MLTFRGTARGGWGPRRSAAKRPQVRAEACDATAALRWNMPLRRAAWGGTPWARSGRRGALEPDSRVQATVRTETPLSPGRGPQSWSRPAVSVFFYKGSESQYFQSPVGLASCALGGGRQCTAACGQCRRARSRANQTLFIESGRRLLSGGLPTAGLRTRSQGAGR